MAQFLRVPDQLSVLPGPRYRVSQLRRMGLHRLTMRVTETGRGWLRLRDEGGMSEDEVADQVASDLFPRERVLFFFELVAAAKSIEHC